MCDECPEPGQCKDREQGTDELVPVLPGGDRVPDVVADH